MNELLRMSGSIHAKVLNRDGSIAQEVIGDNLVVNSGLNTLAHLLAGDPTYGPVVQMKLGTGNTWPSPAGAMTNLDAIPGSWVPKTILQGDISYPTVPTGQAQVKFRATWGENENNGFTVWEVGLFAAGPLMVARYVMPAPGLVKTTVQTFIFDYIITVQAA